MLKKAKAELNAQAAQASDSSKSMAQSVLDSSHQIWLAGLGAFAKAQQGGMQVFDALVKQGRGVEAKTRDVAAQTAQAARGAATAKAKEMQAMAEGTWDKLEQVFENRVARALARLGVYTSSDVQRLTDRVDELAGAVNMLLKAQGIQREPRASPARKSKKGSARTATRVGARTVAKATDTPATAKKTLRAPRKAAKATLR